MKLAWPSNLNNSIIRVSVGSRVQNFIIGAPNLRLPEVENEKNEKSSSQLDFSSSHRRGAGAWFRNPNTVVCWDA
jgi:hypothetical protein